jgi:hypothetical protein
VDEFFSAMRNLIELGLNALSEAVGRVSTAISTWWDSVKAGITAFVNGVTTTLQPALTVISDILTVISSGVSVVIGGVAKFVGGALTALMSVDWAGAVEGVEAFFGSLQKLVQLGLNAVTKAVGAVVTAISTWWENVRTGVSAFASGVTGALQPVLDFVNNILNAIASIAPALDTAGQARANDMLNEYLANNPDEYVPSTMPDYADAQGGPAWRGAATLVGERGPELFIPGADGTIIPNRALGGGQVIIQAVYVQDSDPQRWLDRLQDAARQRGMTAKVGVW